MMKRMYVANFPIYEFEIFQNLPVSAYVSTRLGGVSNNDYAELNLGLHVGDDKNRVIENRKIFAKAIGIDPINITYGQQTHSSNVTKISNKDRGMGATSWGSGRPNTDAMITKEKGLPLAILTADCAAIFLYDPKHKVTAVAHSGRKGTSEEISIKTIQKMHDEFGTCPEDIIAAIGPCIHSCCYDVDLPSEIHSQLLEAGLDKNNIEVSDYCTSCNNDLFFSYRGDNKSTGRFINLISIK